jgi:hypothetical protein
MVVHRQQAPMTAARIVRIVLAMLSGRDPTSPMAKHPAELRASDEFLTAQLGKNHAGRTNKVQEWSTALKIQDAKTPLANVTRSRFPHTRVRPTF